MKFYLVFDNSGDSIPFVSDKEDLLIYHLNFLNDQKINSFLPVDNIEIKFKKTLQFVQNTIIQFNETDASEFTGKMPAANEIEDYLNQDLLNLIHYTWVHSNHNEYSFDLIKKLNINNRYQCLLDQLPDDNHIIPASEILYKYGIKELHNNINYSIHKAESMFDEIKYRGNYDLHWDWKEIKNIFPKNYSSNSTANLKISFNHYGRTMYDKFLNQSSTWYDDENTYNQLLGFLTLSLQPSQTIYYSKEYLEWCSKINREPGGYNLNIGNVQNLSEDLTEYRKIIYRNTLSRNRFRLVI